MNTIIIEGKYATALVYATELDDLCRAQIRHVCNHPTFEGEKIRIMPDVHAGMGCVIGFTSTMTNECVIPNLIGVDIGCGVLTTEIPESVETSWEGLSVLDHKIRHEIPHGKYVRKSIHPFLVEYHGELMDEIERIVRDTVRGSLERHWCSPGSLGGGNHFIEIARDETTDKKYLHIHSGSRNFGNRIAVEYQKKANVLCEGSSLHPTLHYLSGEHAQEYMRDMRVAQRFAAVSRALMAYDILGDACGESFDTVHNYISDDNVMRKGSVSAQNDEILLIPLNMRDGSLLCRGKGNPEYNNSAPHGAGRVYSRTVAKKVLDMEAFEDSMKGIYTTSVTRATLDEAPMAYKSQEDILGFIGETVEVIAHLKPIYNFKAPD